jgi:NAD(P)H dehydrogenase (quinone)
VRVIGLNCGSADRMKVDEITGGAPYAATTIAGTNAQGQPSQNALAARYEGRAIAETAAKLHRYAIRTRQRVGYVDVAIWRNGC